MEKYLILYNFKNTRNKDKWTNLNKYIKKYNIELVKLTKYFSGDTKERIKKLRELARNTVDIDLNYAGMEHLLNIRLKDIPDEKDIVLNPEEYLKSFILVVMDHLGTILEVVPNNTDKSSKFGSIGRYFDDFS